MSSNPYAADKLAAIDSYRPAAGPLSDVNRDFHQSYEQLVVECLCKLGKEIPVMIVMRDDLKLFSDGTERTEPFIPELYHQLKAMSHVAFGLQLALMSNGEGELRASTAGRLQEKLVHIRRAVESLPKEELPSDMQLSPATVLERSGRMIERVLAEANVDMSAVTDYARDIACWLLKNIAFAARLELDGLHRVVSDWRQQMGPSKWQRLYVIICGGHQPRYREAAKQYFERLLHEVESLGGEREDRVLYAEGLSEAAAALDLLARHIIDQEASIMFFGDRLRLQTDVLADAVADYLDELLPA